MRQFVHLVRGIAFIISLPWLLVDAIEIKVKTLFITLLILLDLGRPTAMFNDYHERRTRSFSCLISLNGNIDYLQSTGQDTEGGERDKGRERERDRMG